MMRRLLCLALLMIAFTEAASAALTFRAVDVFVDPQGQALGAYQIELQYDRATTKIVGLEGGATHAFAKAPYYDPRGMTTGRIVVAAFIPAGLARDDAPTARTRVARLHIQVDSDDVDAALEAVSARLTVAVSHEGANVKAQADVVQFVQEREAKDE